ncbi:hypothetical protein GCM10007880_67780 [Mesorhizobium amorphae]|nr:hypothetical protein GCM10007880_67780 [Mesorhizobium amorphae]
MGRTFESALLGLIAGTPRIPKDGVQVGTVELTNWNGRGGADGAGLSVTDTCRLHSPTEGT